ncbi:DUF1638 domain-containing protein [Parasedimentitalea psychrophila]|uniref:DUF1638 domain-containing protein n=1 Tax=Parasedimentitalea psychrophila TaxID=2997337 RepID=A0A9Y2P3D4_9RHOB|nr:DUF1638 domain-containing protein [Parasedimentitalea psychrophila]WIY24164.1 DUF1638 domain-containing protein [Parasedimentitalea psychrophila]
MARRGRASRLQGRVAVRPPPTSTPLDENPVAKDPLTQRRQAAAEFKPGRILLIACGALAREILDINASNQFNHIDLTCLPANLHLYPDQIPAAVTVAVTKHRACYSQIFVVYADCGTGGALARRCAELGVEMVSGPHCYSFFEGNQAFEDKTEAGEITAFYLTDFLVKQFDAFIWRPMGLDKNPELREMFFGNYTKLVYQSQVSDPALVQRAADCATRLGLAFEHRHTGYGDLEITLRDWAGSAPSSG